MQDFESNYRVSKFVEKSGSVCFPLSLIPFFSLSLLTSTCDTSKHSLSQRACKWNGLKDLCTCKTPWDVFRDRQVDKTQHSLSLRENIFLPRVELLDADFETRPTRLEKTHGAHVRRLSTWFERHVHSVDKVHTCQSPRYVFSRRVERQCLAVSDWCEAQQGLLSWLLISSPFPWLRFRLIGSDDKGNLVHPLMRVTNNRWRGLWLPF